MNEQIYRKITDEILNNSEIIGSLGTDYKTAKKSLFAIKKIVDFSSPQF